MWWALVEEIAPCAEEMACSVRGYHVYKDTQAAATGEVFVCSREPINVEKFSLSNYICIKYFCMFSLYENFLQRNKVNYSKLYTHGLQTHSDTSDASAHVHAHSTTRDNNNHL